MKVELTNKETEQVVGGYVADFKLGASSLTLEAGETPLGIKAGLMAQYGVILKNFESKLDEILNDWTTNHGDCNKVTFNLGLGGISNVNYTKV